ncbi:hypothetical protein [Aestuariivirga sp.]|uniref:hypothetical protein n=1 Tax=Aestuariivirga sp. TaxID=2650926 RepID=UPI00391B8250
MLLFQEVMTVQNAELAARVAWPLFLTFLLMLAVSSLTARRSGHLAALISVALLAYADLALMQFRIGRIDHHSVMILCTAPGILLLCDSFTRRASGFAAGTLFGIAAAVGYEALPVILCASGLAALLSVAGGRGREGILAAAITFASVLTIAFVITVAPSAWLQNACDALSMNLVIFAWGAAAAVGAGGAVRQRLGIAPAIAVLGLVTLAGIGMALASEPRCIAGPLGLIDPAIGPIWLSHIDETRSIPELLVEEPVLAAPALLTFCAGLYFLAAQTRSRRDEYQILMVGAFLATSILAATQAKFLPYMSLLAVPPIAAGIAGIGPTARLSATSRRLIAFLALNQRIVMGAMVLLMSVPDAIHGRSSAEAEKAAKDCYAPSAYAGLASLPPGLVFAHINLGPYIVAYTPHAALAGPYHRLDTAAIEYHAIASASPHAALGRLQRIGVRYVLSCSGLTRTPGAGPDSFFAHLANGEVPDGLTPISLQGEGALKIWEVTEETGAGRGD